MVRLQFVHISENAFFSEEKKLSVIGIFDRVASASVPTIVPSLAVSIGIKGDQGKHDLTLTVVSPEKQELVTAKGSLEINQPDGGAHFVINFSGIPLPSYGQYIFKIQIDQDLVDETNFLSLDKPNV